MPNLKDVCKCVDGMCAGCINGKLNVESFPKSKNSEIKTSRVSELIQSDVMGLKQIKSNGGAKYVVTFIDDYSRYTVAYFLASKSEVLEKFVEYKAFKENQINKRIKCIRTDNGGEYTNKKFTYLCRHAGIIHQTTVSYSPQQNGLAERINRTLMERARCMIAWNSVDKQWWAEAINTAAYITNRILCSFSKSKIPIEIFFEHDRI